MGLVGLELFDELIDEAAELRFARLADEGLLENDLVDEDLDIRLGGEMEEGDFSFALQHRYVGNTGG